MLIAPLLTWCRPAAAEDPLTLEALMARLAAVPDRRASFRETRHLGALDQPLLSTGTLVYRRGSVEKVTTWPVPERLQMDGDRLILTAANDPPRVIDVAMAPELRVLIDAVRAPLAGDAAALRRAFTVALSGTLADWTLELVPRDAAGAKLLRRVRLHGRGDQVDELSLTQANGDDQVMTITPD